MSLADLTKDAQQLLATLRHHRRMSFTDILARIARPDRAVGELAGLGLIKCVDRATLTYEVTTEGLYAD